MSLNKAKRINEKDGQFYLWFSHLLCVSVLMQHSEQLKYVVVSYGLPFNTKINCFVVGKSPHLNKTIQIVSSSCLFHEDHHFIWRFLGYNFGGSRWLEIVKLKGLQQIYYIGHGIYLRKICVSELDKLPLRTASSPCNLLPGICTWLYD